MKVLHTADWHIGQTFHRFDRTYEHRRFLAWLLETLRKESVDVLLLSGDVFDNFNPSAEAIGLFYSFLRDATRQDPGLQLVAIAGNHDSAYRLESPVPLLEGTRIHIIGSIGRPETDLPDPGKCLVPLYERDGTIGAWCLAVPYLRAEFTPAQVENPAAPDQKNNVADFYRDTCQLALSKREAGQAILAMGHFHALQSVVTDMDSQERLVLGGLEGVPIGQFPADIQYLALGHIHKAQAVPGHRACWYAGSPLPMSFTERDYRHQVLVFDITDGQVNEPRPLEIPVTVPLLRIPDEPLPMDEVLEALRQLDTDATDLPPEHFPYLQVQVSLTQPEPSLRAKIEEALRNKAVRLTGIQTHYPPAAAAGAEPVETLSLRDLNPDTIFRQTYRKKYQEDPPEALLTLFHDVWRETEQVPAN